MSYAKKKWMDAQNAKKQNTQSGSLARAAGGTSTIEGVDNIPEQNQTSVVYDLLSEGPIEGLVDGTNSIYLEKTPVTSSDTTHQPVRVINAAFTASTGTVVDSDSGNLFSDLSTDDGRRYVRIPGGKKVRTGNGSSVGISGTEGSTIITADSSFFATDDLTEIDPASSTNTEIDPSIPRPYIRIAGAGDNSNVDLVTPIIRFISATSVEIGQPLPRTIAHKTASIDKIATINTISDANTFTISNISQVGTASRDVSSVEVHVSSPQIGVEDVTYNYQNFQYAFFNGLPNQPYLPGYRGIGSSTIIDNPNRAIEQTAGIFASNDNNTNGGWHETKTPDATAQPVIITDASVSNPNDIDSIKLTFKSPSMIATKPSSGDEKPAEAELRIFLEYKKTGDGAFTRRQIFGPTQSELDARASNRKTRTWEHPHNSGKIRSRTKSPFAESFVINLAQYKPLTNYQIRIERTNPSQGKNGNYEHNSPLTLDTVEHRFADKLSYPHAAYAALIFDAETFSKIPTRGYEIKGLKVKVPTNYFPKGEGGRTSGQYDRNVTTGADAGSYQKWDGNFRGDTDVFSAGNANYELVWTDNPAWIFYDLVTNKRYGIGKYIDASQIDKYELYKIARYCDELVSDGKGGTEPRFSANVYIKESADALKVLKDITQVFRGMLYWLNGEIQFSQNRYQQPVYTFSKANVIDKFKYTSTASEFRSNQVRVTWNDPESMYKKQVEIVEDTNNILETGKIVTKDVLAFGCTSRGQAHRFGKWTLFTEILENEVVSFQTSINAGFLKPGDVVLLQDADRDVISNSGRVTNFNPESGLTLDLTAGSGGSAITINGNGTNSGGFPFYTTAQQGENVVFAGEVNLPSSFSQDACMWEHGGTGVGSWLGVRDIGGTYNLTLRSGEGIESVTETSEDGIVTNIPISDIPEFDDQVHTVCWEFAPDATPGTHRLWIDGKLYIDDETTSGALEDGKWSGGDAGGWLRANSTQSGGLSANSWPVTTGSSGLRHYFGELVSSSVYGSSTTEVNLDRTVNLSSGNTFKLSVMYPEGGAYLADTEATIHNDPNNVSSTANFSRGDLITHAKVDGTVVKITNSSQAQNAVDSSGNKIELVWNPNSRVETQTISTTGSSVSQVTVSSGFTSPPSPDFMWAIREYDTDGTLVSGSAQQYVITEIKEEDTMRYGITAAKYEASKFDLVDRGYVLDVGVDTNKLPSYDELTPPPSTLSLNLIKSFNTGLNDETDTPGVTNQIRIGWGTVLNSDGTEYQHLSHFEIKHNIHSLNLNKFKKITAPKDETTIAIPFDGAGTYIVQIQAVNVNGGKSSIVQRKIEVTSKALTTDGPIITKIPRKGRINHHIQCSSSTLSVATKQYTVENSEGSVFINPSNANTSSYQQDFTGMSSGDEAYLLFDSSESATSGDRLKAVKVIEDTTAAIPVGVDENNQAQTITPGFTYLAEVGASNNGITTKTGTISGSEGDNIITGSSTSFTTEFENGDRIIIDGAGATRFYSTINYIESDTKLQIADSLPRAYSGVSVNELTFKGDPVSDVILAKVGYDGSTYSIDEAYAEGTESLGYFHYENTSNTNALSADAFKTQFGRFPAEGDILIVVNTSTTPKQSKAYKFDSSPATNDFVEMANFITGDLVVDGSISGTKINSATKVTAGTGNNVGVLDGADSTFRIYAGHATPASAPFRVTQAGALTATSADITGDIFTDNLVVDGDANVHGTITATALKAGTVTIDSIQQEVWNEIDRRTAPTQDGFYDEFSSTGTDGYYVGVAKNFDLLGPSNNGYQINTQDIDLRSGMVSGYSQQGSQQYTGTALELTVQYYYKLASDSTWTALGSAGTTTTSAYSITGGIFYEADIDDSFRITAGTLTNGSYYHFRMAVTPTVTNNVWADDDADPGFKVRYDVQQSSTGTGTGTGTVTSVASGDGLSGGPITSSGTLAVDSTVVRTSGTQTIGGDKTFSDDIIISGNLDVRGTTTTIDTATLNVEDNNITLNYSTGDSTATANNSGITIQDAFNSTTDATILWKTADNQFHTSHGLSVGGHISSSGTVTAAGFSASSSGYGTIELGGVSGAYIDLKRPNSDDYDLRLITTGTGGQIVAPSGATIDLQINTSDILSVSSTGIDVTGTVISDGLTVAGNGSFSGTAPYIDLFESDTTNLNTRIANNVGDLRLQTVQDNGSGAVTRFLIDHSTGDISFYEDTGTTAKLFWDASTERLGIGTTSPSEALGVEGKIFLSGDAQHVYFGGSNTFIGERSNSTHLQLRGGGNTTAQTMYLDSSGRLGLGQVSPNTSIHIASSTPAIQLTDTDTNADARISASSGAGSLFIDADLNDESDFTVMSFRVDGTEVGLFDTSGNWLVGTTSNTHYTTSTTPGISLNKSSHGLIAASRSSGQVLILNRQTTNGTIAEFRKDGSTVVGVIGADSNSQLVIGQGDTGISFQANDDAIIPRNTNGAARNDLINLGKSSNRFKDLHLGGSANVVGLNTSANITLNDARVKHNNNTFSTYDWDGPYQADNGKLVWTVTGTSGAEMELYSDGSDYTNSTLHIGGQLALTQKAGVNLTGNLGFNDSVKALFGSSHDLEIYHDSNHSYITDVGSGVLKIGGNQVHLGNPTLSEVYLKGFQDGALELYHNNSKKLETTSAGIDVTGTVVSDGLTVDGNTTLNPTSNFVNIKGGTNDNDYSGIIIQSNWANTSDGKNAGQIQFQADDDNITGSTHTTFAAINAETTSWTADSNIGGHITIQTSEANSLKDRLRVGNNGDISFYEDTGTTVKLFWDASAERFYGDTTTTSLRLSSSAGSQLTYGSGTLSVAPSLVYSGGGSERFRVTDQGLVGIGTSSPSNQLHIKSSGTSSAIRLEREDTSDEMLILLGSSYGYVQNTTGPLGLGGTNSDTDIYINASGNVGIGTTSPGQRFHVSGGVSRFQGTTSNWLEIDSTAGSGNDVELSTRFNTLRFDVPSANDAAYDFKIGGSSKMFMDGSGKVGIGTNDPDTLLHLKTATTDAITTLLKLHGPFVDNDGTEGTAIDFGTASDSSVGARIIGSREEAGARGALRFCTGRESDTGFNDGRMVIDPSGNVGIGTTAPADKLDVRDGTITSRDSTNTNYAELDRFVGLTLKGNGAGSRYVKTPNADNLVLGTNDFDRVTILGSDTDGQGKVGINRTDPVYNLDVRGKTRLNARSSDNSDATLYIVDNADDVADQNYNSIHLDYNLSGSDTIANTDRTHRGMFMDIDSSASGGDNADEHRIYGIDVDIDFNGDSDLVVGGRFHVENNNSGGTAVTNIYGIQAFGLNDTSGTARGTNTYGGYFVGQLNHSSTQTSDVNLYGSRSRAYLSGSAIGAGINDVTGSYNEIEVDDPGQSTTVDQAYVGRFIFNNDDTTNNNVSFNDTYLVHGTYGGGAPAGSDSYGIYMTTNVPKHYFGSNVGIGTTSPDALLEVSSDSDDGTSAPIVKITNESTTLADGAVVGTLQFVNKDTSSGPHIGHIQGIANSTDERSVELAFATGLVGTTPERLRIDKDGNIGIGTTSPSTILDVNDNAPILRITDTRSQTFTVGDIMSSIEFDSDDTSGGAGSSSEPRAAINMYAASTFGSATGLEFRTKGDTTGYPPQQMVITDTGRVGIGTASPGYKLHVVGDLYATTNIHANQFFTYSRINHYGDADTFVGFDQNDEIRLTAGGQDVYITGTPTGTAKVGIGLSAPQTSLHIKEATPTIALTDTTWGDQNDRWQIQAQDSETLVFQYYDDSSFSGTAYTALTLSDNDAGSTASFNGDVTILGGNKLKLREGTGTDHVTFAAPSLSGDTDYTLPNAYPTSSGQVLSATTAGVMSWTDASSGTITSATNMADNRILTASGSTTINGEANLTFTGTQLTVGANASFNGSSNQMSGTMDFEGDVLFQGDNASIFFDVSDDALEFSDNAKAVFGSGGDFEIYHDQDGPSYIRDKGSSDLVFTSNGSGFVFKNDGETETLANMQLNGAVTLYYDNSAKLATTSTGIDVTGSIVAESNSILGASLKLDSTYNNGRNYELVSGAAGTLTIRDNDASANRIVVDATGNVGIGQDSPAAKLQVEEYGVDTRTTNTSSTTQTNVFDFLKTSFRSARFSIQITNTTDSTYQVSEIILIHDGTTPSITQYGTIFTGTAAEATFDADISGLGYVRLLATPASADNMTFKIVCHSIAI